MHHISATAWSEKKHTLEMIYLLRTEHQHKDAQLSHPKSNLKMGSNNKKQTLELKRCIHMFNSFDSENNLSL